MIIATHDNETIIALCTPRGKGAIAVLRISGMDAIAIATHISVLVSGRKLSEQISHTVHYGFVLDAEGNHIDQVLFIVMRGPKTFTGQDTVEITCHNNPFIIEHITQVAIDAGARLAKKGEFTKRAVLNNKIDLIQAEAINELIQANTHMALKKSLAQLTGTFSSWVTVIEKELLKGLAFSEASFEFLDEEMEFSDHIKKIIISVSNTIEVIKKNFNQQQHIRQGIRIALIGSVNAGKSSLFNALLNQERAIVSTIAGTTRDVIEAGIYKNNNYWTLIDTAGLRTTNDSIEQEGITRSLREAALADIILLIVDQSRILIESERLIYEQLLNQYGNKILLFYNKSDIMHRADNKPLSRPMHGTISSKTMYGVDSVEQLIEAKINELLSTADAPFLLNQRQFNLILGLENKLQAIQQLLNKSIIHYELLSFHLHDALTQLTELTGKTISEHGMDAIFKEFCIGK